MEEQHKKVCPPAASRAYLAHIQAQAGRARKTKCRVFFLASIVIVTTLYGNMSVKRKRTTTDIGEPQSSISQKSAFDWDAGDDDECFEKQVNL